MILTAAGLSFVGFVLARYRGQLISETSRGWLLRRRATRLAQERVLIVGGGEAGQFAAWLLANGRSAAVFNVVGFVDDDLYKQGMRIAGVRVLGRREDIPRLVSLHDIGILVFAIHNIDPAERQRLLEICAAAPARVVEMPDILAVLHQVSARPPANGEVVAPVWENNHTASAAQSPPTASTPAPELDVIFAELEQLAAAGDLPTLQQRLRELQRH